MQELRLGIWEAERKTALFVTHEREEAILVAGRIVVMAACPAAAKPRSPSIGRTRNAPR
jgi:NitT/TauT family transport system ATP-binding protein